MFTQVFMFTQILSLTVWIHLYWALRDETVRIYMRLWGNSNDGGHIDPNEKKSLRAALKTGHGPGPKQSKGSKAGVKVQV